MEAQKADTKLVSTELLGKAKVPGLPYESADGSSVVIDRDYLGKKRNEAAPFPGPFEDPGQGGVKLRVW